MGMSIIMAEIKESVKNYMGNIYVIEGAILNIIGSSDLPYERRKEIQDEWNRLRKRIEEENTDKSKVFQDIARLAKEYDIYPFLKDYIKECTK